MQQNLANRLAAGGVWALKIAEVSIELQSRLLGDGRILPGNPSPYEVYMTCGVGSFEHVVNTYLPDGYVLRMNLSFRPPPC